ncbi:lysozyme [Actinopolyspora mortivallis]|uniref:lysozyme n=1 Tax=Actinopolyspora mortivallis TaxID=33906 RepID=UPI000686BB6E
MTGLAGVLALAVTGLVAPATAHPTPRADGVPSVAGPVVRGMDVSGHQGRVDWRAAWRSGARFAYVKATEGTGFRSSTHRAQYRGARAVGMLRGSYHFARPDLSPAAPQARFFVANGGDWKPDGHTLPGVVDIEYNPYGPDDCYGLGPAEMSQWIAEFSDTYRALTGRFPMIYTTRHWWNTCTGGNTGFAGNNPLWVARYGPRVGELPAGWASHTMWQYDNEGVLPGDQNLFRGDAAALRRFATGGPRQRAAARQAPR